MSTTVIPIADASRMRKARATPKGRVVDPKAADEIRALLKDEPRRRDLLIEHLHKIQDTYGHITDNHIVALAAEMGMAMTEVFEVATFYHHFDVVRTNLGEVAPEELTVRVCDSMSCELAGANDLLDKLPAILGAKIRVLHAPCVGRCESAPVVVVGQNPIDNATIDSVKKAVETKDVKAKMTDYVGFEQYKAEGGYKTLADCMSGKIDVESVLKTMENIRSARSGRRRLPVRSQVAHRPRRSRSASDGREHRRRRTRHLSRTATTLNAIRIASSTAC